MIYFKVDKDTETGKKLSEIISMEKEFSKQAGDVVIQMKEEYPELLKNLNPTIFYPESSAMFGGLTGLIFSEEPDRDYFSVMGNTHPDNVGYVPKQNTNIGKRLHKMMWDVPSVSRRDFNLIFGWDEKGNTPEFKWNNKTGDFGVAFDPEWDVDYPKDMVEVTYTQYKNITN